MTPKHFVSHLQHDQIVEAIRKAESQTTGEIRVFVSPGNVADPVAAAKKRFEKMGMHRHQHRNGVLIFVAPRSQTYAVVGDRAVHDRVGDSAWEALARGMGEHFSGSQYMSAIVFGIEKAGELLAAHFPKEQSGSADRKSSGDV
jgi:uncharacterized membrane protein